MLKHLKTRGQAMGLTQGRAEDRPNHTKAQDLNPGLVKPLTGSWRLPELGARQQQQQQQNEKPRRVRGRRSSKPLMEKRRRARINECLDILKSYVLGDSSNLSQFGVDVAAFSENQDEETIARTILKSSGLINRHRGRKNPNKLEKADILELTVDYVRRLHEQRDQAKWPATTTTTTETATSSSGGLHQATGPLKPVAVIDNSSTPLGKPLTLSLPQVTAGLQATAPPSPPPSSASNSPQPLLSILGTNLQHNINTNTIGHQPSVDALDLSDSRRARVRQTEYQPQASYHQEELAKLTINTRWHPINGTGLMLVESADGCWRPWNPAAAGGQLG